MKIIKADPPILDKILKAGLKPQPDTIFTIGSTIYNPSGLDIPSDILAHEIVHSKQQAVSNTALWIDRYLNDIDFRIDQEAEAFAGQYEYVCGIIKDRNDRAKVLLSLADNLASSVYGNSISQQKAIELIREKLKK